MFHKKPAPADTPALLENLQPSIQIGSIVEIKDQPGRGIWIVTNEKPPIKGTFVIENITTKDKINLGPQHLRLIALSL